MVEIYTEKGGRYLLLEQLPELEKYTRLYYDLEITPKGIDVINHLLERMEEMKKEIKTLRAQLNLYERFAFEELDD